MLPVNIVDPYSKHTFLWKIYVLKIHKSAVCVCACRSVCAHMSVLFQVITQQLLGGGII